MIVRFAPRFAGGFTTTPPRAGPLTTLTVSALRSSSGSLSLASTSIVVAASSPDVARSSAATGGSGTSVIVTETPTVSEPLLKPSAAFTVTR